MIKPESENPKKHRDFGFDPRDPYLRYDRTREIRLPRTGTFFF